MAKNISPKPLQVFRRRGVSASVFANQAKTKDRIITYHKVSLQRTYRDSDGEWKTTTSLSRDDLPLANLLLHQAWEFVLDQESASGRDDSASEE